MWVDSIDIASDRKIKIKGGADSYSSIGTFVIAANQSPFFSNMSLMSSSTQEVSEAGLTRRIEVFEIVGDIATYQEQ